MVGNPIVLACLVCLGILILVIVISLLIAHWFVPKQINNEFVFDEYPIQEGEQASMKVIHNKIKPTQDDL